MRAFCLCVLMLFAAACGCPTAPDDATSTEESAGGDQGSQVSSPPAEVRALADAERRASPPGNATVAMLARGSNAFVARLEMNAGAAVPEHQDADEEYIIVLEGSGTIWIDGTESAVSPGSTIFMPAGATVRFQNGDAPMVAIQVFAGPSSAAKYERWTPVDAPADPR